MRNENENESESAKWSHDAHAYAVREAKQLQSQPGSERGEEELNNAFIPFASSWKMRKHRFVSTLHSLVRRSAARVGQTQ